MKEWFPVEKFGFILHPLYAADLARKYPFARNLPDGLIERALRYLPPMEVSHITGVESSVNQAEGWFVACLLTSAQMLRLPEEFVIDRIVQAGKMAQRLGAKVLGLGAFTSVVGDAGVSIAQKMDIPVTTGNSYTVATALEGTMLAAARMGLELKTANVVILGATGSIGACCAQLLAKEVRYLTLAARDEVRLDRLAEKIYMTSGLSVRIRSDVSAALKNADIVIAVTSALDSVIAAEDLKPGAIVCDVARPRSVSREVAEKRRDVLVIEGGIVEVPGDVQFNFDFGFPDKMAYACMAETMILALEGRYESFTLGRHLTIKQIFVMRELAKKHGFKLAGLRSFEREITETEIEAVKRRVRLSSRARSIG